MTWMGRLVACLLVAGLSGCGVAALPCRMGSAVISAVPVVGGVASTPTDACASAID